MPISDKKNRAMGRILRNKFHAAPKLRLQAKPEPAVPAAYSLSAEIPKSYNDTYVRAIPKDPQNTFVYWEMPKNEAADNGMEANGKIHAGNGEAAAIQNKVNGGMRRGGSLPPAVCGNDGNNQGNNQNNHNHGNNSRGQNPGLYYDFESNSWRNGNNPQQQWDNNGGAWGNNPQQQRDNNGGNGDNIPQSHENSQDNNQSYHNDSNNFGQNHQHNHDYGGRQDNNQTYRQDDFSHRRNGRHYRQNHDNRQYYGNPEYFHILTEFIPPGNTGYAYLETSGIIANAAVVAAGNPRLLDICKSQVLHGTSVNSILLDICKSQVRDGIAGYSILLDFCKSRVNRDNAVYANLSSGALYKKTAAAPPPHLSSGILYNNIAAAEQL